MSELKPCPFCGSAAGADKYFYVYCEECATSGPVKGDARRAIEAWNQRATTNANETSSQLVVLRTVLKALVEQWREQDAGFGKWESRTLTARGRGMGQCADELERALQEAEDG